MLTNDLAARQKAYLEERRALVSAAFEGSKSFDKAILTLSSSTLAVTMVFLKDIVPRPHPETMWLLLATWALLSLSILATLLSFTSSQKACYDQIEISRKAIFDEKGSQENPWTRVTVRLNVLSVVTLLLGVITWGGFSWINIVYFRG